MGITPLKSYGFFFANFLSGKKKLTASLFTTENRNAFCEDEDFPFGISVTYFSGVCQCFRDKVRRHLEVSLQPS